MTTAKGGRPRREATEPEQADIHRLGKRMGAPAIAARTGLPLRLVRSVLAEARIRRRAGLTFSEHEDNYLRSFAGEQGARRLQRELRDRGASWWATQGVQGPGREWPLHRITERVTMLMGLGPRELRRELSVTQVRLLIGRSEVHIEHEIERKRLKAHRADGRWWSVEPSALRRYIEVDYARVNWLTCEHGEVIGLLRGLWGLSEEEKRERKGKKA